MWYTARIIHQSLKSGKPDPQKFVDLTPEELNEDMFEETIVLVQADDEDTALQLANTIGAQKEFSYDNIYGETVSWKLIEVAEVQEILEANLGHGVEVYHRFLTKPKEGPFKTEP